MHSCLLRVDKVYSTTRVDMMLDCGSPIRDYPALCWILLPDAPGLVLTLHLNLLSRIALEGAASRC